MRTTNPQPLQEITLLLRSWSEGNDQALNELTPLVYNELRRAAQRFMARETPKHILQRTALVNEVYLRLDKLRAVEWQDRGHFYAVCARMMRRILTDYARSLHYAKRGGMATHITLDEKLLWDRGPRTDLVALDEALEGLGGIDQRKSQVVELRFFGGLSVEETADALKISEDTVKRDWKFAKHWLLRELERGNRNG
jgi:RNA polymerase sigma-70 factor (ECF subfamily)